MSKTVAYCCLIVACGIVIAFAICAPTAISDQNGFLKGFVSSDLLNVLGVILAITLASAAQLHLTFNGIEERYHRKGGLTKTRAGVHSAARWLIALFAAAVALVVGKPYVVGTYWLETLFNGAAVILVLWNVLLLISLTQTIFRIEADVRED